MVIDVKPVQFEYLEVIDYQLFAVYTVEKWIGIWLKGCGGEDLMFLTCVYAKMWEEDAMTLALSAP